MSYSIVEQTAKAIDNPEAGSHIARLIGLVNLGMQPGYVYNGEDVPPANKMTFTYELVNSKMKDGRPHVVSEDMKISGHEASKMFKRIQSMDPVGDIIGKNMDISKLIGVPCMVTVQLSAKGWPKINAVTPAPTGFPVPEQQNESILFDITEPDYSIYTNLPKFVQDKLKQSLDYEGSELNRLLVMNATVAEDIDM